MCATWLIGAALDAALLWHLVQQHLCIVQAALEQNLCIVQAALEQNLCIVQAALEQHLCIVEPALLWHSIHLAVLSSPPEAHSACQPN